MIILTGAAVLLLWIPIRQMPGLGTVSNVIVLGLAADATLAVLPPLESMVARSALLVGAIVLNAIATGMYIGAGFGPGPRDGLMTGLHARTGWSLRGIRTAIELSVLLIGWLLGGKFGVGTVIYALSIGPLIQLCLPWFSQPVSRNAVSPPREIVS
ncbi:membrane protein [Klebsiella pneumoniae subsp. pneumoniae]|uniref:Membrane protein n=1 Tax=Klebsiella pneumoniae subsp. ozaenae TaxID=574 RepID=A0A377Z4S8_KLEPO|nr:membrane protein [Klebsiella pneumoniae subsp. ozaenae]STV59616.1 membrane protein [Klebsiella pneumoniae subsp. pneumoniae]